MSPSTTQPWANRMRYSDQWTRRIRYSDQHIRVSDAERNAVAELLGQHYADGRLDQAEFDDRIARTMAAKTRGDLAGLFDDLPETGPSGAGPGRPRGPGGAGPPPRAPAPRAGRSAALREPGPSGAGAAGPGGPADAAPLRGPRRRGGIVRPLLLLL